VAGSSSGAQSPLAQTRRLLFEPVDAAYVRRHASFAGTPAFATLGSRDDGRLLLRFAIELPPESHVVEAFVILERATAVDAEPVPITLRAGRVTESWDGRSVDWAHPPHVEDLAEPLTRWAPGAGPLVRINVRDLVRRWLRRGRDEFGIAVSADGPSDAAVTFVLLPSSGPADGESPMAASLGPRLELYVK
jgi:hypothetical protein